MQDVREQLTRGREEGHHYDTHRTQHARTNKAFDHFRSRSLLDTMMLADDVLGLSLMLFGKSNNPWPTACAQTALMRISNSSADYSNLRPSRGEEKERQRAQLSPQSRSLFVSCAAQLQASASRGSFRNLGTYSILSICHYLQPV